MLQNKPIRRPGMMRMGCSMYGDDDSLSVTAAGKDPGTGSHECVLQTSLEAVTEEFREGSRGFLDENHHRSRLYPHNGRSRVESNKC